MKTVLSKVAIATALIVVSGLGWFGLKHYKQVHTAYNQQPTDGSVSDGIYTNTFFKFRMQFPSDWKVLSAGSGPELNAKATSFMLLLVGSPDRQTHGTRWVMIAAARPPASSPPFNFTANDFAKSAANLLEADVAIGPDLGKKFRPAGQPSEISIGGRQLVRLDLSGQINVEGHDYDAVSSQLVVVERGYVILLYFTDPKDREAEPGSAGNTMASLRFF